MVKKNDDEKTLEKIRLLKIFSVVMLVILLASMILVIPKIVSEPIEVNLRTDSLTEKQTLSTSGDVTKFVEPNKVEISFTIETINDSAKQSQEKNAIITNDTLIALKNIGVKESEIKTISYNVFEEFAWNKITEKSESKGYRTNNNVMVTLSDTKKTGEVLDTIIASGVTRVSSVTFGLTKEKELEVKQLALKEASENARTKANSIVSGLNMKVNKVSSVSENSYYYSPIYKSMDMIAPSNSGRDEVITPIIAGEIQVTASISIVFEIE